MEKVKLTFILLFLAGMMFGQNTIKVGGVVFSYDKKTDTMRLLVPDSVVTSEDPDWEKQIIISKNHQLSMTMNGKEVVLSDTFYYSCGRSYNMGSHGIYKLPVCDGCECNLITDDSFSLEHPPKGEYILSVSDVCDGKWVTDKKTGSIIIN
jgi:hypothetical protein